MKRFILSLLAVAIILVMAVSCSKDETNDMLPVVGNADLNGQKMELTYSLLGKLNIPSPPGVLGSSQYVFMLAGGVNAQGNLTKEPYLFGSIHKLPERGSQITFDLKEDNISLRCILRNKEYLQHPTDMTLSIVSGTLRLQRSVNDIFNIEFDIRTTDGNILSGTAKLNYIP